MDGAMRRGAAREWEDAGKDRQFGLLQNRWFQAVAVLAIAGAAFYQGIIFAGSQESPVVYEAGALVAAGELESILYDPSLGAREDSATASDEFRDAAGRKCRTFSDGPIKGVACRANGDWRVTEIRQGALPTG